MTKTIAAIATAWVVIGWLFIARAFLMLVAAIENPGGAVAALMKFWTLPWVFLEDILHPETFIVMGLWVLMAIPILLLIGSGVRGREATR